MGTHASSAAMYGSPKLDPKQFLDSIARMQESLPQMSTIETTQSPPAKLAATYKIGFVVLLNIQILWSLYAAFTDPSLSRRLDFVLVSALAQVFGMNMLFLLIASAISVVGVFMTKGSRLVLFARIYFFVMAILTPLLIMSELFRRMAIDR